VCVCILALVIQHANDIFSASYYIVIYELFDSVPQFYTLFLKRHDFLKKSYWIQKVHF